MSHEELMAKIRRAQIEAAEKVVVDHLKELEANALEKQKKKEKEK